MSGAAWPLQEALYARLTEDAALTGLVTGIFDHPPKRTSYPYVLLGEDSVADWSSKTFVGEEHTLTLHVYSRYAGRREVKAILAHLHRLIHQTQLSLANHRLTTLRVILMQSLLEPDGLTYHGILRARARTHDMLMEN